MSTHCALHIVAPALQAVERQRPALQVKPVPQGVRQVPQLVESVWRSTQRPLQFACPSGHTSTQRPCTQNSPTPQRIPQAPQLVRSTRVLAQ
jgi:hypothetical protein